MRETFEIGLVLILGRLNSSMKLNLKFSKIRATLWKRNFSFHFAANIF